MSNLILCDDHKSFREGIKQILSLSNLHRVVAEASQGTDLLKLLDYTYKREIILLDMNMSPGKNGYEIAREILSKYPDLRIIIFSGYCDNSLILPLLEIGVYGQISKNSDISLLYEAIESVENGFYFYDNKTFDSFLDVKRWVDRKGNGRRQLTEREFEVAKLMSSDKAYKEIAKHLTISPNTVENIRVRIFEKTGAKTRTEVAVFMMRLGLV